MLVNVRSSIIIFPELILPDPTNRRIQQSPRLRPRFGECIAALMPVETAEAQKAQSPVIFPENFSDELRRKAPVGK